MTTQNKKMTRTAGTAGTDGWMLEVSTRRKEAQQHITYTHQIYIDRTIGFQHGTIETRRTIRESGTVKDEDKEEDKEEDEEEDEGKGCSRKGVIMNRKHRTSCALPCILHLGLD